MDISEPLPNSGNLWVTLMNKTGGYKLQGKFVSCTEEVGHAQGPAAESISEGIDQERFSETAIAHGQQPRSAERTFVGYRS